MSAIFCSGRNTLTQTDNSIIIATEHAIPLYKVLDDLNTETRTWGLDSVFVCDNVPTEVHRSFETNAMLMLENVAIH